MNDIVDNTFPDPAHDEQGWTYADVYRIWRCIQFIDYKA